MAELEVAEVVAAGAGYRERSPSGDESIRQPGELLRIRIDARSLEEPGVRDGLDFLGLEGDIEMFLERSTRVPVEVRGRVPFFGELRVLLRSATLR